MKAAPALATATYQMQQDADLSRIKKLLLFASRNVWESDPQSLDQVDMTILLQEVYQQNPTPQDLKQRLTAIVAQVSKRAEYSRIARRILGHMGSLYALPDPSGQPVPLEGHHGHTENSTGNLAPAMTSSSAIAASLPAAQPWAQVQLADYDPFWLRREVMSQINPLRAKILLFSALHHNITIGDGALSVLKQHSLDALLYEILTTCPDPETLEVKLLKAEEQLGFARSSARTAMPLLQVLKPLYIYAPPPAESDVAEDYQPAETWVNPVAETLEWMDPSQAQQVYDHPVIDPYADWDEQDLYQDQDPSSDWIPTQIGWNQPPASAAIPAPVQPIQSPPAVVTPDLGPALRQQVDFNVGELMATIENVLSELGNHMDECLQEENPAAYLDLKHRLLRAFLVDVEGASSAFLSILTRLQESERRVLHPQMPAILIPKADQGSSGHEPQLPQILAGHFLSYQNPGIRAQLDQVLTQAISDIKNAIENKISEFGNELDESLQVMNLIQGFQSKYDALRAFIRQTEAISAKFANLLDRMESAERKLFGL